MTLKQLRAGKNLNQEEAAKLIGVSKYTWMNYEKEESFPNVLKIAEIEEAFGVNYADINFFPSGYDLIVKSKKGVK